MSVPDIAVINFSAVSDRDAQEAIRAVNRQVMEDFMPIWGSGYRCKLHASPFSPAGPDVIQEDPVQAEAVKSVGAGWLQWLNYSIQPQVMPRMISGKVLETGRMPRQK